MHKHRWLIRSLILAIFAAFIVWLEPTRVAWGWLRREAFFKGRPTSYWRGEMERWQFGGGFAGGFGGGIGGGFGGFNGWQREPDVFQRHFPKLFPPPEPLWNPPFINKDPELTPVLHALKNDPSRRVRLHARYGLWVQTYDLKEGGSRFPSPWDFGNPFEDPLARDW